MEWTSSTGDGADAEMKEAEQEDKDSKMSEGAVGNSNDQPAYSNEMALLHADIAGWLTKDNEDDEVLSIESSNDDDESPVTVYYPLFPTPL